MGPDHPGPHLPHQEALSPVGTKSGPDALTPPKQGLTPVGTATWDPYSSLPH